MEMPFVMVAEDEPVIGLDLCETVAEAGCHVDGPFPDVSTAMLSYQKRKPDVAILDVSLGQDNVFPLAETLIAEHVPVIFHSALYSAEEVISRFPGAMLLPKPCPPGEMLETLRLALRPAATGDKASA